LKTITKTRYLRYKDVQTARKEKTRVKKETIVDDTSQVQVTLRVKVIVRAVLFDKIETDGVTIGIKKKTKKYFEQYA
jgi:hypothetical protein